ncbi:MAG: hypothetical protein JWP58_1359 [Hymenobacter sp.]|nr:hypothetical protein [Hymenobacter sp.]
MALWSLTSQALTRLLLWRTGDSTFRIVQYDEPAEVLTNYDYLLFDKKYEPVLQQLQGQIDFSPVIVTDGVRHLVWENYFEVRIHRLIDTHTVHDYIGLGLDMYRFGEQSMFVSEALKKAFEKVSPQGLHFSLGLSEFAA